MTGARMASIFGTSVALACAAARPLGAPAAPSAPAPSRPAATSSAQTPAVAPSAEVKAPALPPARLEPASAPVDPKAHVEILFPFAEQRILIPKAMGYSVRTKVAGWPLAAEGRGVLIALDHHRPRRLLEKAEIKLGALSDDGVAPAPGPHWLVLAAVDERGALVRGGGGSRAPFSLVRFWVGDRDPNRAPAPQLALLSPAGTYNGERAAGSVVVDFLAAPERLGKGGARVKVVGPNVELERRLDSWQPLALSDLPSGDYSVEVDLLDEHGKADDKSSTNRTVSVNRELSDGGTKKH